MAHEHKLIEHLSKEIETHTNNLMTFRARVSFAALVGPFVLLGSLLFAAKRIPSASNGRIIIGGLIVMALCYLTMGWSAASIERHTWRQCNVWRRLIAKMTSNNTEGVSPEELEFNEKLRLGYLVTYGAMVLAFGCVILIIRYLTLPE